MASQERSNSVLKEGKSLSIDRFNLDSEQRSDFVKHGCPQVVNNSMIAILLGMLFAPLVIGMCGKAYCASKLNPFLLYR
ncbi:hypothetical protein SLEP1_g17992 [Rubroshorea leprosula]|uniref:Uncharacterized protein n=1 Tax=Rubroshorea leprosula TaxID=152421 RepID=A0AAV5J556_9ROSI|nr:hypothetical protein SLEP1_g17992 [Rubroshorea leprosula]